VTNHLKKYFELSLSRFSGGDYTIATFFALTTIEECAKILQLRDADLKNPKHRRRAIDHKDKYLTAVINLIDQSSQLETLSKKWQDMFYLWFSDVEKLVRIRNRSLYLSFNNAGKFTTPDQAIDVENAALLVYLAGIAMAELEEFISGVEATWAAQILKSAEEFRTQFLLG